MSDDRVVCQFHYRPIVPVGELPVDGWYEGECYECEVAKRENEILMKQMEFYRKLHEKVEEPDEIWDQESFRRLGVHRDS